MQTKWDQLNQHKKKKKRKEKKKKKNLKKLRWLVKRKFFKFLKFNYKFKLNIYYSILQYMILFNIID